MNNFDRAILQVSKSYSQELLVDNLMPKVNISVTYLKTRHHGTDPDLLAWK